MYHHTKETPPQMVGVSVDSGLGSVLSLKSRCVSAALTYLLPRYIQPGIKVGIISLDETYKEHVLRNHLRQKCPILLSLGQEPSRLDSCCCITSALRRTHVRFRFGTKSLPGSGSAKTLTPKPCFLTGEPPVK